jgi:peptidoglycan/xylan/chitin deacetylase (PgdA/CDA1 family)
MHRSAGLCRRVGQLAFRNPLEKNINRTTMTIRLLLLSLIAATFTLASPLYAAENKNTVEGSNAVVLAYQRFGNHHHSMYVSEDRFRAHLDYLESNGFHVWPLARIVRRLRTGQPIPDKTVAITIDDTHPSVYNIAYRLLREKGYPFTVFVVPDKVDQIPLGNISWDQMREMKQHGASFANHSINHIHLVRPLRGYPPRAWVHYVRDNVLNAQSRIQEELGPDTNQSRLFSYPYGEYSIALANILADIGYTSFGQNPGAIGANADLRALPRFLIQRHNSSLKSFARKVNSVALPVTRIQPWNPMVDTRSPSLKVELSDKRPAPKYLSCYTREGRRVSVKWGNRAHTEFTLSYSGHMPLGYSYFQCTSRYNNGQRLYWFSQPWIIHRHKQPEKTPEEQEAEEQAKDLKEVKEGAPTPDKPTSVEPDTENGGGSESKPESSSDSKPDKEQKQ